MQGSINVNNNKDISLEGLTKNRKKVRDEHETGKSRVRNIRSDHLTVRAGRN